MKLNKLIGIRNILVAHANDRVYAKVAYKMMKFIKASEDEDAFYNTKLKELIETHGEKDAMGKFAKDKIGNIKIKADSIDECREAIRLLEETDVDCPNIHFCIEELSELRLSMSEMYAIDEIIIEEG